ncbi:type IX secretion system membrane protein PorP/SprF [Seonamhaeicola algicola]|uniref:Type IX secretion system membrane protein PorP/SprF n=1 Tax=Seonamhaeicola algicola TaxID=1719036 RepID=A0A5C7B0W1_9FLAO|nr:PorP/SprF family type IX secretion system membrane protein [Seonamhaeicola algicola]TXE11522.1 type IX secretion system membrane protein PorP/SprF [Seonamhaeicola algicola]
MFKTLLYVILFFCFVQITYAQETENGVVALDLPVRNSLKFNRYAVNPTFSFVREQNKYISFSNKRQWTQFENPPQTYLFSFTGRIKENIGASIGLFQQDYGVQTVFGGILNFAYNAAINRDNNLTFGLNIGAYQSGINEGKVVTNTPEPVLNNIPNNLLLTINPGINYGTEFFDFGLSINNLVAYNLNTSKIIEDNPQQSLQAHVMYTGYMNTRGFFDESKFTTLITSEFKKEETVISGLAMLTVPKGIWGQIGYNTLYGASAGVGINVTEQIALEYNFEKSIGDLAEFGTSHEFSVAYKFKNNNRYVYSGDDDETALLAPKRKKRTIAKRKPTTNSTKSKRTKSAVAKTSEPQDVSGNNDNTEAQAKAEAEALRKQQEAEAQAKEAAGLQALEAEKARLAEAARLKAEQEQQKAVEEAKAKAEAEAEALRKQQAAEAQAKEAARVQALEADIARLAVAARLKAEQEQQKAAEEAKAQAEAEALRKQQEAEAQAKEAARLQALEAEKARLAEAARLKAEQEAAQNLSNLDEETVSEIKNLNAVTDNATQAQGTLIEKLTEKVAVKQGDLDALKKENDLSEQGIVVAPRPFKSIAAENAEIESIKNELDQVIEDQRIKIEELQAVYISRKRKVKDDNDPLNAAYLSAIEQLKAEQLKTINAKANLEASLQTIKVATDVERRRRIKRAAYDNQKDRFVKDSSALSNIKRFTDPSSQPLTTSDFDFGEKANNNIQIVKNVAYTESGYYIVLAVHSSEEKRDDFLRKAVAAGQKDINFFFDVNTNKYFIYYDKFDSIEQAQYTLQNESKEPYDANRSIVKIEN